MLLLASNAAEIAAGFYITAAILIFTAFIALLLRGHFILATSSKKRPIHRRSIRRPEPIPPGNIRYPDFGERK